MAGSAGGKQRARVRLGRSVDASASLRLVPNSAHGREPNSNALAIRQPNSDERRPRRYAPERVRELVARQFIWLVAWAICAVCFFYYCTDGQTFEADYLALSLRQFPSLSSREMPGRRRKAKMLALCRLIRHALGLQHDLQRDADVHRIVAAAQARSVASTCCHVESSRRSFGI
jgi:hypothetical protein